jgi:hypothetical protein
VTGTQALARNVAVIACAISAGVHAGLVPEHIAEDPKLGVAFALASVLLVALAVALARSSRAAVPAAVLLAVLIVSYGASRTVGLPLVREHTEPLDALGVIAKAIEAVGLIAALRLYEPASARLALGKER